MSRKRTHYALSVKTDDPVHITRDADGWTVFNFISVLDPTSLLVQLSTSMKREEEKGG